MRRAAVQNAELHTSSLHMGREIPLVGVVGGIANTSHVKCIASSARVVGMRRKCLFSRVMTDLYFVVHVTNHNELVTQTTEDHVGNGYDRDCG